MTEALHPEDTTAPARPAEEASAPPVTSKAEIPADVRAPAFAEYPSIQVSLPESFPGGYSLPVDLGAVGGMDQVTLSDAQKARLSQNGFVVAAPEPGKYPEFYQVYESLRYDNQPVFATTDAVFQVYHLIFDKMLRDLEREKFIPILQSLTETMLKASQEQLQALEGSPLEDPALRNVAFFGVSSRLLGLPGDVPAEARDMMDAELALIEAHVGPEISPIWDEPDLPEDKKLKEDYSQYNPRGHYTRSDELKTYFKAMMWYGRLTFRLRDAFETRRALLLVQVLRGATAADGTPAAQLWQNIYEPTVFIVGKADDLSYFEYGALSDEVFGANASPEAFAGEAKFNQFVEAAKKLPPPQVNSMWVWIWEDKTDATQGFRFIGQRFTLDEYVFGQMIWRNVGTLDVPRGLPKALDFFAAQGSEEALNLLKEMGEAKYASFDSQMAKVRKEVSALELDSWTQNLYWSWLYALHPLVEPKGQAYPAFMQTQAWARKDLHTALASWTELKHDTTLYAKQVMAEMGAGGDQPPHGYVEPNPEAFARLLALSLITKSGLESRGLLSDMTRGNLENLIDMITFLKSIAEKELNGGSISDDEYWRIQFFGGQLEAMTLAASDRGEGDQASCRDLSDQRAALVADVATGLAEDGSLVALEEGVGEPTPMYVVLPDEPYRVGVGAVFTDYEFGDAFGFPGLRGCDRAAGYRCCGAGGERARPTPPAPRCCWSHWTGAASLRFKPCLLRSIRAAER